MLGATKPFLDELLKLYGQRATEALATLVNNERFVQSVQLLLERSLEFRELLQKSLSAAFEQMNLPTRHDTDEIKRRYPFQPGTGEFNSVPGKVLST